MATLSPSVRCQVTPEQINWRWSYWTSLPPLTLLAMIGLALVKSPSRAVALFLGAVFGLMTMLIEMIGEWWEVAASALFGVLACVILHFRRRIRFAHFLSAYLGALSVLALLWREANVIRRDKRAATSHFKRQLWLLPPKRPLLIIPVVQAVRGWLRR